ncbi:MAG: hypothetical protein WCS65_05010 [Verrucomicrobiae bacterium]
MAARPFFLRPLGPLRPPACGRFLAKKGQQAAARLKSSTWNFFEDRVGCVFNKSLDTMGRDKIPRGVHPATFRHHRNDGACGLGMMHFDGADEARANVPLPDERKKFPPGVLSRSGVFLYNESPPGRCRQGRKTSMPFLLPTAAMPAPFSTRFIVRCRKWEWIHSGTADPISSDGSVPRTFHVPPQDQLWFARAGSVIVTQPPGLRAGELPSTPALEIIPESDPVELAWTLYEDDGIACDEGSSLRTRPNVEKRARNKDNQCPLPEDKECPCS